MNILEAKLQVGATVNVAVASDLLYLCALLELKFNSKKYGYVVHKDMLNLFTAWYSEQVKIREDECKQYPIYNYPDVCMCGNCFSESGSVLRQHCIACKGDNSKRLITIWTTARIASHLRLNSAYVESVFAKAIYALDKSQRQDN